MMMVFSNGRDVDSTLVEIVTFYHRDGRIGLRLDDGTFVDIEHANKSDREQLEMSGLTTFEKTGSGINLV
jgi:hypothetical protein